ncbi:MAG: methyltransferase domain-containing protein [Candidatus Taylorbacteria bacterium]|nr:methyltransferase domain-containing protein [Candidatus Taylorbacteria bacterium]
MDKINFFKTAVKELRMVGALTPSSRYVVKRLKEELGNNSKHIVEYGAGDGVIVKEILRDLPTNGRYVAIEINPQFLSELHQISDPRLTVLNTDVRSVLKDGLEDSSPVTTVISGIPFTFFSKNEREEIIQKTYTLLAPGGKFLVYQVTPLVYPILKKYFSEVKIRFEPLNIPPYFIMIGKK